MSENQQCPAQRAAEAEAEVQAQDPDMIKVRIPTNGTDPSERLWAKRLEDGTARLDNCPLSGGYAIGDIVELDAENNVTGVRSSKNVTVMLRYWSGNGNENLAKRIFLTLVLGLESIGCEVEGGVPGVAMVCVPRDLPFEEVVGAMRKLKLLASITIQADEDSLPDKEREGVKFLEQSLQSEDELREALTKMREERASN